MKHMAPQDFSLQYPSHFHYYQIPPPSALRVLILLVDACVPYGMRNFLGWHKMRHHLVSLVSSLCAVLIGLHPARLLATFQGIKWQLLEVSPKIISSVTSC